MRGIRGKAVLRSTWQMRGVMDAAGAGRDELGGETGIMGKAGIVWRGGRWRRNPFTYLIAPHWAELQT